MRVDVTAGTSALLGVALTMVCVGCAATAADESTPSPATAHEATFIALPTPRPVTALRFTGHDDAVLTLADFHGRMVLLNLWATWCVPCRAEMPALDRLQARLGGPGFTVVPLSIDHRGRDAVARFYRDLGLTALGIYVDTSANVTYAVNATGMPTTLLIDGAGREVGRVIGPAEWDSAAMLSRLTRYLQGHGHGVGTDAPATDTAGAAGP